jgi:hypothetical protein
LTVRPPSRRFDPSSWIARMVPAVLVLLLVGLVAVLVIVAVALIR